ncbi:MAG: aminopeptidase P family protein [Sphaerochaetaceae bacterium]
MNSSVDQKLALLRDQMKKANVDAYIVSGNDPHSSEYVAPYYQSRIYLSQFSGSAGSIVVTKDKALLWVDSRYYIQGAKEIEGSEFILMKLGSDGVLDPNKWLAKELKGKKVGINGNITPLNDYNLMTKAFEQSEIEIVDVKDLFEDIWENRPDIPNNKIKVLEDRIAGLSAIEKIGKIREELKVRDANKTIISSLDDIAWTLNLRGDDVKHNRLFFSYLVLSLERVDLFVYDLSIKDQLDNVINVHPYSSFFDFIKKEINEKDTIYYSPAKTTVALKNSINSKAKLIEGVDITTHLKAAKNQKEIDGMRKAHLYDGIAVIKLLAHLENSNEQFSELSIADKLEEFRKESPDYLENSFSPIAGFKEHGALAHYSATDQSSYDLVGDGLLVLDSGGQYKSGTTDITRTLLFGQPTDQMKIDYTLVLKGNLALTNQQFPKGTYGYQLDILARQYLWQMGLNYGHGTGHGVGFCLNVHEGPQNISPRAVEEPLVEGMVLSNEPGLYKEGRYGIRLENLIVVQKSESGEFGDFYQFEVLTIAPFERKLIDKSLLTDGEIAMVDNYHSWVYSLVKDLVDNDVKKWLEEATSKL